MNDHVNGYTPPTVRADTLSRTGGRMMLPAVVEGMTLNEPNLNIRGGKVRIEAWLDHDGVLQLEATLAALRMVLKPRTDPAFLVETDVSRENIGSVSKAYVGAAEPAGKAVQIDPPDPFGWRR